MEKGWDKVPETHNKEEKKLESLASEDMEEIKSNIERIESDPRISTLKNKIAWLKSFNDLPLKIDYQIINHPISSKESLPTTIDIAPKPLGKKRILDGKEVKKPDPVIISLNNRKFSVTPDIGGISKIAIENGGLIMETTFKNETYNAARLTKLLLLLRRYKWPKNQDIAWTPLAQAREI
jgi:hypothetical protein